MNLGKTLNPFAARLGQNETVCVWDGHMVCAVEYEHNESSNLIQIFRDVFICHVEKD